MPKKHPAYKPGVPPEAAIAYFKAKGWKVGFDYRDVWNEEHAYAFTVAKATTVDVLETLRGSVDTALAEGQTLAQFKKNLQPELERLGWWGKKEVVDPASGELRDAQLGSPRRLKVIYQTNMRTARAAGKWDLIEQTKDVLPFLQYRLGPSEQHRPEHVALEGKILSADDPFWDTHYPPNGWGCKCWVKQLSQAAADRAGGASASPKIQKKQWFNERTGQTELVPEGIDPGFAFNPGKVRVNEQLGRFNGALNAVYGDVAEAVHSAWMQPGVFGQWRKKPQGSIPVAVLDAETQALLGATQRTVLVSDYTMKKQDGLHPVMSNGKPTSSKGHPELSDAEYCLLPTVIDKGQIIQLGVDRLAYFHHQGRLYKAVVKSTAKGETFVESFHRSKETQPERELKKEGAVELRQEKR